VSWLTQVMRPARYGALRSADRPRARQVEIREMAAFNSPDLIRHSAPLLWGARQWRAEMAQALGIDDRTIRKWVSGEAEVPIDVWQTILRLIWERRLELDEAAEEIEAYVETMASADARHDRHRSPASTPL